MTSLQKIIKYGAIAFAFYLIIMIVGMIVFSLTTILGITVGIENYKDYKDSSQIMTTKWEENYSDIKNMNIELKVCKLEIVKGDKLKVETFDVSNQFECKTSGDTLRIKDKEFNLNWFDSQNVVPRVIIHIPEDLNFDRINIETGVNKAEIDYLNSERLDLKVGVGKCDINKLVAKHAKIECGTGNTVINDSTIDDLKLNCGIGKLVMTSEITESGDINSGVGKVELNLKGGENQYKIKTQTGLGNFTVAGKKVRDDDIIGNGKVSVKVNAGVGDTSINFKE